MFCSNHTFKLSHEAARSNSDEHGNCFATSSSLRDSGAASSHCLSAVCGAKPNGVFTLQETGIYQRSIVAIENLYFCLQSGAATLLLRGSVGCSSQYGEVTIPLLWEIRKAADRGIHVRILRPSLNALRDATGIAKNSTDSRPGRPTQFPKSAPTPEPYERISAYGSSN